MHLLDNVVQSRQPMMVRTSGSSGVWCLPGADVLAADVEQCPLRYVLHDDVTEMCTRLAFEAPMGYGLTYLWACLLKLRQASPCLRPV